MEYGRKLGMGWDLVKDPGDFHHELSENDRESNLGSFNLEPNGILLHQLTTHQTDHTLTPTGHVK